MRTHRPWGALALVLLLGCSEGLIDPSLYEPLPRFGELDFTQVHPSAPFDLWEIREAGMGTTHVLAGGGLVPRSSVSAALLAQFDNAQPLTGFDIGCLPGFCYKYVVTLQGNEIRLWFSVEQLVDFLGTIDNRIEAAIVAESSDFYWTSEVGGIRDVAGGFELVVLSVVSSCAPFRVDRSVVRVRESGEFEVLRSERWSVSQACA